MATTLDDAAERAAALAKIILACNAYKPFVPITYWLYDAYAHRTAITRHLPATPRHRIVCSTTSLSQPIKVHMRNLVIRHAHAHGVVLHEVPLLFTLTVTVYSVDTGAMNVRRTYSVRVFPHSKRAEDILVPNYRAAYFKGTFGPRSTPLALPRIFAAT